MAKHGNNKETSADALAERDAKRDVGYDEGKVGEMIRRINEEASRPLTDFERNFMESVTDDFDRGVVMSERRLEIIEQIERDRVR